MDTNHLIKHVRSKHSNLMSAEQGEQEEIQGLVRNMAIRSKFENHLDAGFRNPIKHLITKLLLSG